MMRCRFLPEMPVRGVEISKIARNQIFKGLRDFFGTVPDVSDVWWPHAAHSKRMPPRISRTRVELHLAHAGLPPQRASIQ